MLDYHSEAEDIVQQAWLRLDRTDTNIDSLPASLNTVTARSCLDRLRPRTDKHRWHGHRWRGGVQIVEWYDESARLIGDPITSLASRTATRRWLPEPVGWNTHPQR